jgi:hypothetical protein
MEKYFVVKFSGKFGFIKPWTAVRDSETYSQQFLTPSIIEGIEKKLFPELLEHRGIQKVVRHRLSYAGIDVQQERTWSKGGFLAEKKGNSFKTNLSIISRGIMLDPVLHIAFLTAEDAQQVLSQHICLCRNEDILFPSEPFLKLSEEEFDQIDGFELRFDEDEAKFKVGHNRYDEGSEMYGYLKIFGNPIRHYSL